MVIEPLTSHHDRSSFDCGKLKINEFLQKTARQYADKDVGVTHVVVEQDGDSRIIGFVTLSMKSINRESLPTKGLPRGDFVVGFIGQLATDEEFQGQGIGIKLLYFTLYNALKVSETFGLLGVALDLLQDEDEEFTETEMRRKFYMKRGFMPLVDDDDRLYVSMKEVRKMALI